MTAYADAASLAAYLGRDLTDAESAQVDAAVDAATDLIDRYTQRSWQATTITGEQHAIAGASVYLRQTPVSAISSATLRSPTVGSTIQALVAGTDYELLNAQTGQVLLGIDNGDIITSWAPWRQGSILAVTYTVSATVPASISLAANMLAAQLLAQGPQDDETRGLSGVTIGDFSVRYATATTPSGAMPPDVAALLNGYRRALTFA